MSDNIFIDTNILVYLYSIDEPQKKNLVEQFILSNSNNAIISTQVINEFISVLHKKKKIDLRTISNAVQQIASVIKMAIITGQTIQSALLIAEKYKYSYFDCLMIASAIENNCKILFTEDMQNQHSIDKLIIKNPFH
jgi:predicted nucleic acid-binding protein